MMKYINRIYRCSQVDRANFLKQFNLSAPHLSLVLAIKRHPGVSQDDLAKFLFVNKSTVTRQLKVLEEEGYIIRETGLDRRSNIIYLSEKGKSLHPMLIEYLDEVNNDLIEDLSEQEYEIFLELITKITKRSNQRINHLDWEKLICE